MKFLNKLRIIYNNYHIHVMKPISFLVLGLLMMAAIGDETEEKEADP